MPTINQLVRIGRKTIVKKVKATALRRSFNAKDRKYNQNFNPQKRGVVILVAMIQRNFRVISIRVSVDLSTLRFVRRRQERFR